MSEQFWENRWLDNNIGWDLGEVSPPIKSYINQLEDKTIKILIPGCGNAYEAEYLLAKGFNNVFIVEISKTAIKTFKNRCPQFSIDNIIEDDFFKICGQYDLIIEQTLFCALEPIFRKNYVEQMTKLLKPGGKLVGLLFNRYFSEGPPFGGDFELYKILFSEDFKLETLKPCYNSIEPRQGTELFVKFIK
jgi:SAM-dependent methyltransferase